MKKRSLNLGLAAMAVVIGLSAEPASRGYLTTPQELAIVRRLAEENRQPYKAAVDAQLAFAESKLTESPEVPAAYAWGNNKSTSEPRWMTRMSTAAYGCALAFRLSGKDTFANKARDFILAIQRCTNLDADGQNQSQLNVSIHIPKFIYAADLLEDWPGWSAADRRALQTWICERAYPISRRGLSKAGGGAANWAAWEQAAGLAFADYCWDRADLKFKNEDPDDPVAFTAAEAWDQARTEFLESANGLNRSGSPNGSDFQVKSQADGLKKAMIRPDGGVPDELRRGGADTPNFQTPDSTYLTTASNKGNASVNYMGFHRDAKLVACEIACRRGDCSLYENIVTTADAVLVAETGVTITLPRGRGSPRELLTFMVSNQDKPAADGRPAPAVNLDDGHAGSLELHLRRYQGKVMKRFVGWTIRDGQFVGGRFVDEAWPQIYVERTLAQLEKLRPLLERWVPFTTLTHADPLNRVGEPPVVPPPGGASSSATKKESRFSSP